MDEKVKKELETIKRLVLRWKKSYLGWATPDGPNEYLLEEFSEEITMYVSPLLRRFLDANYLSPYEHNEFLESCYSQINELREQIKKKEAEHKQPKKGIWA